jgi:hypothetical protein
MVPSAPAPRPAEEKEDGTEDMVPSAPAPPPAEPKEDGSGLGKRLVVVGVIVAALIVAAVGVVRWRSSGEDAPTSQGQTIPTTPSTGSSATSTGAPAVPAATTVTVPATQDWTDTGLSCEPGLILEIAATGMVLYNLPSTELAAGPDGSTDPSYHEHNVAGLPDANHANLIGRLDQAQPFVVGAFHTHSCAERGRFFLGINDKGVDNNSGDFIATVLPKIPSTGSSTTSTGAPAVPAARTINVPATQKWTDTGLTCEPGLILEIGATGTVLHDMTHPELGVGPNGSIDPKFRQYNVDGLPDANHANLIGRLDQAQPFVVGAFHTHSCAERGRFFLGINDKGVANNSGAFIATIRPHR